MATTTIQAELVELEREYWQAMKDKDVDTALRLSADACIITGAQGVSRIDHGTYRKLMTGPSWSLVDFEFSDVQTQQIAEDVHVLAYKVTEKLTVEGKPLTLVANDSTTWVRRDGRWLCAVHTEAPVGDPFGRDKKPKA